MADIIKIKRGKNEGLYGLQEGEVAYHTSEKALYIGTKDGNVLLCRAEDVKQIDGKLTAEKTEMQASLNQDAQIGEVVTAFNNLIAALKESGVMETE